MSAGQRGHRHFIRAEEKARAVAMLHERRFRRALRCYGAEDNAHRIIFLAGSDTEGETVFYDKDLPPKIKIERSNGRAEMVNPRRFLWWHETVEGILIRRYGFDYDKAHRFATAIERIKVEAAGYDWNSYERALKPFIHADEQDAAAGMPKTILLEAYRKTRWYPQLERMQRKAA